MALSFLLGTTRCVQQESFIESHIIIFLLTKLGRSRFGLLLVHKYVKNRLTWPIHINFELSLDVMWSNNEVMKNNGVIKT